MGSESQAKMSGSTSSYDPLNICRISFRATVFLLTMILDFKTFECEKPEFFHLSSKFILVLLWIKCRHSEESTEQGSYGTITWLGKLRNAQPMCEYANTDEYRSNEELAHQKICINWPLKCCNNKWALLWK